MHTIPGILRSLFLLLHSTAAQCLHLQSRPQPRNMDPSTCSERRGRVNLNRGHDRRDELEEDDEVEVDAHALDIVRAVVREGNEAAHSC